MKTVIAGLALIATACSSGSMNCPGNTFIPLTITVVDTANGENVCDAQVTATDGSSTFHASGSGATDAALSDASCQYTLGPGRSGTFKITASAAGLHMTQPAPTISLQYDQCGPSGWPQYVTIPMSP
jgi:hypothetical protein